MTTLRKIPASEMQKIVCCAECAALLEGLPAREAKRVAQYGRHLRAAGSSPRMAMSRTAKYAGVLAGTDSWASLNEEEQVARALDEAEFLARISHRPAYVIYDDLRGQYRATQVGQGAGSRLMEIVHPEEAVTRPPDPVLFSAPLTHFLPTR